MSIKTQLHPRNIHKHGYDFTALLQLEPRLKSHIVKTKNHELSINFSDPTAVYLLNFALLKQHYHIETWQFPKGALCPPIPGRVDYLHYLADLLKTSNRNLPAPRHKVSVLDIGTGASCIYPILGSQVYDWKFVATDIDPVSIEHSENTVLTNPSLHNKIECRLQSNAMHIFTGIIGANEQFDLTICNPPFHKSLADASTGSARKWQNLNLQSKQNIRNDTLNFGGQNAELYCSGGELTFIKTMINESKKYDKQVLWFSCLVSKKEHLSRLKLQLKKAQAKRIEVIKMAQGNKMSRFLAWSFQAHQEHLNWCDNRFRQTK